MIIIHNLLEYIIYLLPSVVMTIPLRMPNLNSERI